MGWILEKTSDMFLIIVADYDYELKKLVKIPEGIHVTEKLGRWGSE